MHIQNGLHKPDTSIAGEEAGPDLMTVSLMETKTQDTSKRYESGSLHPKDQSDLHSIASTRQFHHFPTLY